MKNKIPAWPLYTADGLMFISVLLTALPNIKAGEPLSGGALLLCCILVLCGMFLALVPYLLDYKKDMAKKAEHTEEEIENFKLIFDDLAALRLGLADLEEHAEKTDFKVSEFADSSAIDKRFSDFESAVNDFKNAVKTRLKEMSDSADSTAKAVDSCELANKELKKSIEDIGADLVVFKDVESANTDSIDVQIEPIRKGLAELGEKIDSVAAACRVDAEENLKKAIEKISLKLDAAADKFDSAITEITRIASDEGIVDLEDPDYESEEDDIETECKQSEAPSPDSMLGKALNGAKDSKATVEKFFALGKNTPDAQKNGEAEIAEEEEHPLTPSDVVFTEGGEKIDQTEPIDDSIVGEIEEETPAAPTAVEPQPDADANAETSDSDNLDSNNKAENKDFFDLADSAKTESASTEKSDANLSLFADIPESSKPRKPSKGEAAITVNALIGIGNKPYLRGDGGGLSQDVGTPMEFVEIGKWCYVMPQLENNISFKVLKNDKVLAHGDENYTIGGGEKLELNLSFPLED